MFDLVVGLGDVELSEPVVVVERAVLCVAAHQLGAQDSPRQAESQHRLHGGGPVLHRDHT